MVLVASVVIGAIVLAGGRPDDGTDQLAFVEPAQDDRALEPATDSAGTEPSPPFEPTPTDEAEQDEDEDDVEDEVDRGRAQLRSEVADVALGESVFGPLPTGGPARAVRTPTGIVLPVLDETDGAYLALTPCEEVRFVDGDPIMGAHVVLDPGHGGTEPGAVTPDGSWTEADINLVVATAAEQILTEAGAVVVLTRRSDHNLTTGARGVLAKRLNPALFVSIHHNGGASPVSPGGGGEPGVMAFTKAGSERSRRFGGLFHQSFTAAVEPFAEARRAAHLDYRAQRSALEAEIDRLVQATENPRDTGTGIDTDTDSDGDSAPAEQPGTEPKPNTELEALRLELDELEVAEPFGWAGTANAGVRSWIRPDGKDYLSVLRHSGEVTAVLAEFVYLTNPAEARLLDDPAFVQAEARALADAIITYFSDPAVTGTGFVADDRDDQPIGGGGLPENCVEPELDG